MNGMKSSIGWRQESISLSASTLGWEQAETVLPRSHGTTHSTSGDVSCNSGPNTRTGSYFGQSSIFKYFQYFPTKLKIWKAHLKPIKSNTVYQYQDQRKLPLKYGEPCSNKSFFSTCKDFNYMHHLIFKKWQKCKYDCMFPETIHLAMDYYVHV